MGFRVTEGAAELRVRGASAVSVDEGAGTSVVVHVVGTIPGRRVDRLPLDTSAFGTMLSRVEVVPQARGLALRLSVARGARVSAVVEGASGALVRVEGGTASVRE